MQSDINTIKEILEQLRREIDTIKRLAPAVRAARAGHPPRRRRTVACRRADGEPPNFEP